MNISNGAVRFLATFSKGHADVSRASRGIRRVALQKIATLTATTPESHYEHSDLERLCDTYPALESPANGLLNGGSNGLLSISQAPMVRNTASG